MARFSLLPREEHFFHDFVGLSEEIRVGARTLKQMVASNPPDMAKADVIKDIEHACDGRTRSIIDRPQRVSSETRMASISRAWASAMTRLRSMRSSLAPEAVSVNTPRILQPRRLA